MQRHPGVTGAPGAIWTRIIRHPGLLHPYTLLVVYTVAALAVSLQQYHGRPWEAWGGTYTHYNNFQTFRYSFPNLCQGKDLYSLHPEQHADLYKYSPAFAVFMAPFWYLPPLAGLMCWNLLNALILFHAIRRLPLPRDHLWAPILWFVLIELVTSMQNSQSNGLMTGLLVLGFAGFERGRVGLATFLWSCATFIKLFALPAFLLAFCFRGRWLKTAGFSVLWFALLALLPLLVTDGSHLSDTYRSWFDLLAADTGGAANLSVAGWLQTWFGFAVPRIWIVGVATLFLIWPLVRHRSRIDASFRLLFFAAMLVWVVIFNHKAESPTYVVAMTGVAIWYFSQVPVPGHRLLAVSAFVFSSLSPTFVFPDVMRTRFFYPWAVKAVACIAVYARMLAQLAGARFRLRSPNAGRA